MYRRDNILEKYDSLKQIKRKKKSFNYKKLKVDRSEFSLWYVKSKLIRRMLRKPTVGGKGEDDEVSEDESNNDTGKEWMQKERVMTGIKKEQQIRHARDEKMEKLDKQLNS